MVDFGPFFVCERVGRLCLDVCGDFTDADAGQWFEEKVEELKLCIL